MKFHSFQLFLVLILALLSIVAMGQDNQYSQFYNAPLYLNPAFAGTGDNTRGILNYRSQWPGVTANTPYSTYSVAVDHHLEPYNSGIGLLITRDRMAGNISMTDIGLQYAYQVDIGTKWSFRPALQASVVSRSIDYSQLVFGDQLTANGNNGTVTSDRVIANGATNRIHPDFSAGGLVFSDKLWVGFSAHHLAQPNIAFGDGPRFGLPIKFSGQAGMRIPLGVGRVKQGYKTITRERSFLPCINYKRQGAFNQLDAGAYMIWEPMMFGITYRGIPGQQFQGFPNNEALIFMLGVHFHGFSFGYSYDIILSSLTLANSAGAHEVSLIYEWNMPYPKSKKQRPLPCPRFYKSGTNPKR